MKLVQRAAHQIGRSLVRRLFLVATIGVLPSLLLIGFIQYTVVTSRATEVRALALASARQAASEIDRIMVGIENMLFVISRAPVARQLRQPECNEFLAGLKSQLPQVTAITIADKVGWARCSSSPIAPETTIADRPYFQEALQARQYVVGRYLTGRLSNRGVIPVALATREEDGSATGVIAVGLDVTWLSGQLESRSIPPGGSLTVADQDGTIIVRHPLSERFVGTVIPSEFHRLIKSSTDGVEEVVSQDGTKRILGYVPVGLRPVGLYISAGLSQEASYASVQRAANIGVVLVLAGSVLTILVTWLSGRRLLVQPIQIVFETLQDWRLGNTKARTGLVPSNGDIAELGAQLDRLLDEVATAQEQRALMNAELSHRLKNAFSTLQGIATGTFNNDLPAREVLPSFLSRIQSLARASDILLGEKLRSAELVDIVSQVLEPLVPDSARRTVLDGISVRLAERDALAIAMTVHELGTNAVKYGALSVPEGRVSIRWSTEREDSGLLLRLDWQESDGPLVQAPHRIGFGSRLLKRVFTGNGSVSVDYRSSGVQCSVVVKLEAVPSHST